MFGLDAQWMLVILTFAYSLATGIICIMNAVNNSTLKKQAIDSNDHQKQNAGIQLYALRKNVLAALDKGKYDEIYWDVAMLFDADINKQFLELADVAHKLQALSSDMSFYERFLVSNTDQAQYATFKAANKLNESIFEERAKKLGTFDKNVAITVDGQTKQLNYHDLLKNKHELSIRLDKMRLDLSVSMQKFIKDSIK